MSKAFNGGRRGSESAPLDGSSSRTNYPGYCMNMGMHSNLADFPLQEDDIFDQTLEELIEQLANVSYTCGEADMLKLSQPDEFPPAAEFWLENLRAAVLTIKTVINKKFYQRPR